MPWRPLIMAVGSIFLLAVAIRYGMSSHVEVKRLSDFGGHTLYLSWIILSVVLMFGRGLRCHDSKRVCLWPVTAGLVTALCVESLKYVTQLRRPDGTPDGFPSGHTTFAYALAWLLSRIYPRLGPLWFGVAVSIGWSRVEGHAHFPYQVLWGAILGTAIGWWVSRGPSVSRSDLTPETKQKTQA
ncbi:MAG: phosphatase PAP2 family protein [Armatimonadota bacterium]|nr:phosphatase PAP2 family protein [Armatimonadota bacterium]